MTDRSRLGDVEARKFSENDEKIKFLRNFLRILIQN